MDWITSLFASVCGQGRCFIVDGAALPVCQRCLGLYLGAVLTGLWLLGSGLWRRGLPSRRVWPVQAIVLFAALLSGVHAIDAGPTGRLLCGLWTGHVASLWLWGGARHLRHSSQVAVSPLPSWTGREELQSVALVAMLAVLSGFVPHRLPLGWYGWTFSIIAGAASLLVFVGASVVAVVSWGAVSRKQPAHPEPPTHTSAGKGTFFGTERS
jgi:hypothetical protein